MAHVVVNEPGKVAVAVPVDEGLRVGRHDANDVVLGDHRVSRDHARLVRDGDGVAIEDLSSRHGTRVNGEAVEAGARRLLADGDRIQIGEAELIYSTAKVGTAVVERTTSTSGLAAVVGADADEDGRRLRLIQQIASAIGSGGDVEEALGKLLDATLEAVGCDRGVVGLIDPTSGGGAGLRRIARTRGPARTDEVVVSRVMLDAILSRHESLLVFAGGGNAPGTLVRQKVQAAIGAPLLAGGRLFGFIYVDDRERIMARPDLDFVSALAHLLAALLESSERRERAEEAASSLRETYAPVKIVGESQEMTRFLAEVAKVAPAGDANVLVRGESGTGKELVARTLHERSSRREGPWVALNCAAMPDTMVEAELFGHERGAFTGAAKARKGTFVLAHRGSLFLDEIGDLSLAAQAKVLRAIEEGEIQPLGSEAIVRVDVRVITATHKDLAAEVAAGRFRQDLYYRLAVVELSIPPLRDRGDDVRLLAESFLSEIGPRLGKRILGFTALALDTLRRHPWPGNVRELRNEVERAAIVTANQMIGAGDLSARVSSPPAPAPDGRSATLAERYASLDATEQQLIEEAVARAAGNVSEAARLLGITRIMMVRRLSKTRAKT